MKRLFRTLVPAVLIICISLTLAFPLSARAAEPARIIRVGYVFTDGYQEGGEGEYKTGLGYEYYQKIAYYTGWEYEYVYGGFSELLEKLGSGEIDIMGNLSYTEARAKTIDFSAHEQGTESYDLYTLTGHTEIDDVNIEALNGKRVGISKGSLQYGLFLDWCDENGITCEVIEYTDKAEREAALNSGTIYATVAPLVLANDPAYKNWRSALRIGDSPYYFGVSKHCDPAVLEELNSALEAIFFANPNYFEDIFAKYYAGKFIDAKFLTRQEQRLLTERQNAFTVGYLDNYLPFSDTGSNGDADGLLSDFFGYVKEDFGVALHGISFSSYEDMHAALISGEIDIMFPVHGDYWAGEQQGIFLSNTVTSGSSTLLYLGSYSSDKTKRIAVSKTSPFQKYSARIYYPDAELLEVENVGECLLAVTDGEADSTIILKRYLQLNDTGSVSADRFSGLDLPDFTKVCFGVRSGNTVLLSILDKWIEVVGSERINQSLVAYSHYDREITLVSLISDHPITFIAIAAVIIIAVVAGSILYVKASKRRSLKLMLAQQETHAAQLDAAEQKALANEAQKALDASRMRIMINQMQPHFLYNSLSAIRTIVKRDPEYAYDLLYNFTVHLRSSIRALSSDAPIPFTDELKNVEAYLNIEKMRFEALNVVYDIQCDDFKLIPLSVQPLAENAAKHGLYRKKDGESTITIRSSQNDASYIVEVIDNGVGFNVEETLGEDNDSIGLKNLIFRMKSLMNAEVLIESRMNEGTHITLLIPKER